MIFATTKAVKMNANTLANLAGLLQVGSCDCGPQSEPTDQRSSRCAHNQRPARNQGNLYKNATKNNPHIKCKSLNKLIVSSHLILIALCGANVSAQYFSPASGGQLQAQQQPSIDQNCNDPSHAHNLQQRQEHLALNQPQPQQPQSQIAYPLSLDLISQLQQQQANSKLAAGEISPLQQQQVAPSGRSRSPRSIGDMFRKLFNTNKRSKQTSGSSSGPGASGNGQQQASLNSRDWEQQQHSQQQQQQQHFHQQNQQALAAQMAAAAASQHAVYASPYATASSPAALYAQNPYAAYSPAAAGLYAWPAASFQGLRPATPAALLAASPPQTPASPMAPMFAAASQSYTSYAPAPQTSNSNANLQPAASHTHPSAVPAPAGMAASASSPAASAGPNLNSLDFHQVLDAFVRTSGFAPAGDSEAAYGQKGSDGTPVFSFKKLISLPFYLSTEDKSLDGLSPAGGQGYSMHSMPLMRRHVRRMSTVGQQTGNPASSASSDSSPYYLPAESVANYRQYDSYINAVNNHLAAVAASGSQQQQQYYNQQYLAAVAAANAQPAGGQQSAVRQASPLDAMAAESALANYYATVNGATYKPSGLGNRDSNDRIAAGSSLVPTAVQAPSNMISRQQQQQLDQDQQRELQQLINAIGEAQASKVSKAEPALQYTWPAASQPQVGEMSAFINQFQQASNLQPAQQQPEPQFQNYGLSGAKFADSSSSSASATSIGQQHKSSAANVDQVQSNSAASQTQQQQSGGQQQADSMQTQGSNLVPQTAHQSQMSVSQSQQIDSAVHGQPVTSSAERGQQHSSVVIAQSSANGASSSNSNSSQNQPNRPNPNATTGHTHHHHPHMQSTGAQANLEQQQQQQQQQHQAMPFKA